jgi:hypothetical protein
LQVGDLVDQHSGRWLGEAVDVVCKKDELMSGLLVLMLLLVHMRTPLRINDG